MCGILGGYYEPRTSLEVIDKSLTKMYHRGPDDSGIFMDGPVFLANRRLSIIDVDGGHQPIKNEDGSVVVVLNGEIYNYIELIKDLCSLGHNFTTKSDTEALVHLWEEYSCEMCSKLRGMFAFAIWDAKNNKLFLARDRFGKKPFYFSVLNETNFIFASELKALKALAESLGEIWTISDQAIYHYLSLGVIPQPYTVYNNARALEPGAWMLFEHGKLTSQHYWKLDYGTTVDLGYQETLQKTRSLIKESVRLRLRSDVPIGVFLSGGIDSSIVAYEAAQLTSGSVLSLTVSVPSKAYDESDIACRTSCFLGIKNVVCPVEFDLEADISRTVALYDQPFADASALLTLRVAETAKKYCKVVLTGDGGDELFAGYRRHVAAYYLPRESNLWRSLCLLNFLFKHADKKRRSHFGLMLRLMRSIIGTPAERYLRLTSDMLMDTDKRKIWLREPQESTEHSILGNISATLSGLRKQMDCDVRINLLSDLLVKMDMATMASSLEARSPFLDHVLAEFAATLPGNYLVRRFNSKRLLRDAYRAHLPPEVILGKKRGFELPMNSILRNELNSFVSATLGARNSQVSSFVDAKFVKDLLAFNTLRDRNWAQIVYSLLILEIWLRQQIGTSH